MVCFLWSRCFLIKVPFSRLRSDFLSRFLVAFKWGFLEIDLMWGWQKLKSEKRDRDLEIFCYRGSRFLKVKSWLIKKVDLNLKKHQLNLQKIHLDLKKSQTLNFPHITSLFTPEIRDRPFVLTFQKLIITLTFTKIPWQFTSAPTNYWFRLPNHSARLPFNYLDVLTNP